MKQKITFFKVFLTLVLLCGVGNAWGETKTFTFSLTSNPGSWPTANSTTLTNYTYTLDGTKYTFALKNVKCNSGYLMLTSTAVLGLPAIEGYALTKVIAKNSGGCSTSTNVGISSSSSSASYIVGGVIQTWSTTSSSYTYNLSGTSANTMYYLYVTNKNAQITELSLTYDQTNSVATPIIDPAGGPFLNSATATITCATEGATICYTTDGTDPTDASSVYSAPFNVTETTTIKAVAYKDGKHSSVATATYTKIYPITSMDAVFEASGTAGYYWITFDNWIVSGVKGNNAYLTDNNGKGLIIYKEGHGFAANDVLSGTVNCALTKYNGSAEITSLSATSNNLTVTHDGTLNTIETTIANLGGVNTGAYVDLGTLTYKGTNFTDGTNTIKPYNTFITLPTLNNGVKYKVKGMYMQFGDTKEIAPLTADDFEEIPATKYEINIDELTNGTITASAEEAVEGAEITLTITPDAHYVLKDGSLCVMNETTADEIDVVDNKFTMPASDVFVSAEFVELPKHTVLYSVLGEDADDEEVYAGETIANAPTPDGFDGWEFAGWTTDKDYAMSTTAPDLFTATTPVDDDYILYAVFSKTEGGTPTQAKLTNADIQNIEGSYKTGKVTTTDGDWNYNACTQTNTKTNVKYLQIRKNSTLSYVQIPELSGNITSIVLEDVVNASNGAFTGDIYFRAECSNDAEALATANAAAANDDVTLTIPTGVKTGYIMASAACRFQSITVNYSSGTTCYTTNEPQTQPVTISEACYATAFIPFAATVEGATAYYVTVSDDKAQLNEIEGTIPANTGVVLKGSAGTVTFTESAVTPTTDVSENKMVGTLTTETFSDKDFVYYRLANNNGSVGFYKQNADGSAECAAGKAVLAVPASAVAPTSFTFDDATAINAISNVKTSGVRYNLNGQAVGEDYKGIVIVNGKKMFNK